MAAAPPSGSDSAWPPAGTAFGARAIQTIIGASGARTRSSAVPAVGGTTAKARGYLPRSVTVRRLAAANLGYRTSSAATPLSVSDVERITF